MDLGQGIAAKLTNQSIPGSGDRPNASALHEAIEIGASTARYMNANVADDMIPVNADVPSIDIIMVPERDERVNPVGVKGIGAICIVGIGAAVANAVSVPRGNGFGNCPYEPNICSDLIGR